MNVKDEESQPFSDRPDVVESDECEHNRRKLMTKLAVGAFAVPAVLVTLSRTAAHASVL